MAMFSVLEAVINYFEDTHADGKSEETVGDDAHTCEDFDHRWEVLCVEDLYFARQVGQDNHLTDHICVPAISNYTDNCA